MGTIAGRLAVLQKSRRTAVGTIAAASADIELADDVEIQFVHSVFASVGLPRRRLPQEEREFIRTSGRASLLIQAGKVWDHRCEQWVEQPVPYGPKPRLFINYLCTYATQKQTRLIPVGSSLTDFMRMLGEPRATGGAGGTMPVYREQLLAFAAAHFTLGIPRKDGPSENIKADPIEEFALWAGQGEGRWPESVTIGERFFQSIIEHAVPLDARALRALRGSAMQMDVYTWLAHRLLRVGPRPEFVRYMALAKQFGQEYADQRDFKRAFKIALRRVLELYSDAKVELHDGGVLLKQSRPPIPKVSLLLTRTG